MRRTPTIQVPTRRKLRGWVLGSAGTYIAVFVFVEQFVGLSEELLLLNSILLAVFILVFDLICLQFKDDVLGDLDDERIAENSSECYVPTPKILEPNDPNIESLKQMMEQENLYRQEGLTIGLVAGKINIQEYRLRQLINQELGYRNFNDYLNSYRIQEACERLLRENAQQAPILTIALDTGFRSLSAFNRAFKLRTGITPRQYRENVPMQERSTSEETCAI